MRALATAIFGGCSALLLYLYVLYPPRALGLPRITTQRHGCIRRALISDFVIAMSMRELGLRTVLAPEAICYEETLGHGGHEPHAHTCGIKKPECAGPTATVPESLPLQAVRLAALVAQGAALRVTVILWLARAHCQY